MLPRPASEPTICCPSSVLPSDSSEMADWADFCLSLMALIFLASAIDASKSLTADFIGLLR